MRIACSRARVGATLRFVSVVVITFMAGCGEPSGPPRLAISGAVSLDGRPLESGHITFLPVEAGVPASAEVIGGAYRLEPGEGPSAGAFTVEIVADRPTGKRVPNPDFPSETIEEVESLIPSRYNSRTGLRAEVKPEGPNTHDFQLSSKEDKPLRRKR